MNDTNTSPFVESLNDAAQGIYGAGTTEGRLQAIVEAASKGIPGFDQVSISVAYRESLVETLGASSGMVLALDLLQYETEEGPCFDAFTLPSLVMAPVMRHEQRWPAYTPCALREGVAAQMAVPLRDGREVRGALNLYSTTTEGIDPEAPDIASLLATHVALALGWARTEEHMNTALSTRKLIGQAIGLLMERYQINDEKAFAFLVRVSSTSNIKLRDVAQEVVTQSNTRYTVKDS